MSDRKIKTLISIDRIVWSQIKAFATEHNCNLPAALELLLTEILTSKGYFVNGSSNQSRYSIPEDTPE